MRGGIIDVAEGDLPNSTRYISGYYIHLIHSGKVTGKILPVFDRLATIMANRIM